MPAYLENRCHIFEKEIKADSLDWLTKQVKSITQHKGPISKELAENHLNVLDLCLGKVNLIWMHYSNQLKKPTNDRDIAAIGFGAALPTVAFAESAVMAITDGSVAVPAFGMACGAAIFAAAPAFVHWGAKIANRKIRFFNLDKTLDNSEKEFRMAILELMAIYRKDKRVNLDTTVEDVRVWLYDIVGKDYISYTFDRLYLQLDNSTADATPAASPSPEMKR